MKIHLNPIAYVQNDREELLDDHWGTIISKIKLIAEIPAHTFDGIDDFSHLNIIFFMDKVKNEKIKLDLRHPRNNPNLPKIGLFAQRNKNRLNKIGLTTVKLLDRTDDTLIVERLDAIHGTPVLDIKPVMKSFMPQDTITQPEWVNEIMNKYW